MISSALTRGYSCKDIYNIRRRLRDFGLLFSVSPQCEGVGGGPPRSFVRYPGRLVVCVGVSWHLVYWYLLT